MPDRWRERDTDDVGAGVDMAPLIDMVFILLIFFLVTSTFARESGLDVARPQSQHGREVEQTALRLGITGSGAVILEGRPIPIQEIPTRVRRFAAGQREPTIVLIPDRRLPTQDLVTVMDAARAGGVHRIVLATVRDDTR